ncbi:MAG TPA: hypothetical protein V6D47_17305 [Oscillatoriaceae cyanobacterium]
MTASAGSQLVGFLADISFVGAVFGLLLYGCWMWLGRETLVGLGRLSLVIAFGAGVMRFALGHTAGFPFLDLYLFVLIGLFLLLEFLFQMSVLGLLVSAVASVLASLRYWPLPPMHRVLAPNAAIAYWWVLRDLAVTTGAAVMTLGIGSALLLYLHRDRRPSTQVHPNDLRDVASLLAKGAVPLFAFGAFCAGAALSLAPGVLAIWGFACLVVLTLVALAWLAFAGQRRYSGGRVLLLTVLNVLAIVAYASSGVLAGLTPGGRIP